MELSRTNVLGVLSLILWTLIVTVCIKYVYFMLEADNKGEGGILSLMSLASKKGDQSKIYYKWIVRLGLVGAALLYGDAVITPAISVLSAVEGLKVATPVFTPYIIPITIVIIFLLFMMQQVGAGRIGVIFGPIIALWFLTIGSMGLHAVIENPDVLAAINPWHAINFFIENGGKGIWVLGSVVLVITGGEALYADMGHFGKKAIRHAWYLIAFPALVLNYLGQGATLLSRPEAVENPFYLMAPDWALVPLVILSTFAACIASQALISGVFSITRQAVQLGFSPRVRIVHTSSREIGQIYVPVVNWIMMVAVIWLVIGYQTSSHLAAAYGIAVTGTMAITSVLAFFVAVDVWKWSLTRAIPVFFVFLFIDLCFFGTNMNKIEHGGWVPLVLGGVAYLLMSTWQKGRRILGNRLLAKSLPVESFINQLKENPPMRVEGSAIYMSGDAWGVPVPLLHNLKHNKVLHKQVALLTIKTKDIPWVGKKDRIQLESLDENFFRIIAYYGFMEIPKIKHILEACREKGIQFNVQETTFVLGRETILATGDPTLPVWREKIFAFMARNAERPTTFFKIPPNQVIEVGIQVEI